MNRPDLSYPRLKIYKSKFPGVRWLVVCRKTKDVGYLVGRFLSYVDILAQFEDEQWCAKVMDKTRVRDSLV